MQFIDLANGERIPIQGAFIVVGKRPDNVLVPMLVDTDGSVDTTQSGVGGGATAANQATQITAEQAILAKLTADPATQTTLAAILAKLIAAPATDANQTTGNASLASIDGNVAKTIPATTAAAVTPSDSTVLASRAVWVGGAGDLAVRLSGAPSTTVVFTAVPAGTLLPISVVRIMAATTATNIVVLA